MEGGLSYSMPTGRLTTTNQGNAQGQRTHYSHAERQRESNDSAERPEWTFSGGSCRLGDRVVTSSHADLSQFRMSFRVSGGLAPWSSGRMLEKLQSLDDCDAPEWQAPEGKNHPRNRPGQFSTSVYMPSAALPRDSGRLVVPGSLESTSSQGVSRTSMRMSSRFFSVPSNTSSDASISDVASSVSLESISDDSDDSMASSGSQAARLQYALRHPVIEDSTTSLSTKATLVGCMDHAIRRELGDLCVIVWSLQRRRYQLEDQDQAAVMAWLEVFFSLVNDTLELDHAKFFPLLNRATRSKGTFDGHLNMKSQLEELSIEILEMRDSRADLEDRGCSIPFGQTVADLLEQTEIYIVLLNEYLNRKQVAVGKKAASLSEWEARWIMRSVCRRWISKEMGRACMLLRDRDQGSRRVIQMSVFPVRVFLTGHGWYQQHVENFVGMRDRLCSEGGCSLAEGVVRDACRAVEAC